MLAVVYKSINLGKVGERMVDISTEKLEELENEVTSQNTKLKKMEEFVSPDKLYQEPVSYTHLDVYKRQLPTLGGQAGLNLGMELAESGFLEEHGVKLIGTTAETIFKAEDRQAFKDTMEKIGEPCAPSLVVHNVEDGIAFTNTIGYPVVLRPA